MLYLLPRKERQQCRVRRESREGTLRIPRGLLGPAVELFGKSANRVLLGVFRVTLPYASDRERSCDLRELNGQFQTTGRTKLAMYPLLDLGGLRGCVESSHRCVTILLPTPERRRPGGTPALQKTTASLSSALPSPAPPLPAESARSRVGEPDLVHRTAPNG